MMGMLKGMIPMFTSIIMLAVMQGLFTSSASAKSLVSITITGNQSLVYDPTQPAGSTQQQLHVIGVYNDNSSADVTSNAVLTSSSLSVATIVASGVLTVVGVGSTTITATIGTLTATFNVNVTAASIGRTIIDIVWD